MKKVRMIVSAAIVFAVVGGAFAFKPLGSGNIYCIDPNNPPAPNTACPIADLVQYVSDQTGVSNPCPNPKVPRITVTSPSVNCVAAPGPKYKLVDD
jgi:hypothetical protein